MLNTWIVYSAGVVSGLLLATAIVLLFVLPLRQDKLSMAVDTATLPTVYETSHLELPDGNLLIFLSDGSTIKAVGSRDIDGNVSYNFTMR